MVEDDNLYIMYPIEYLNSEKLRLDFENKYLKQPNRYNGNTESFLESVCKMFFDISNNSQSVSDTIDIGLTGIIDSNLCRFQIRKPIRELLHDKNIYSDKNVSVI